MELKQIISQLYNKCRSTFAVINDDNISTTTTYSSTKTENTINNALIEPKQKIENINEELDGIRYLIIGEAEEVEF